MLFRIVVLEHCLSLDYGCLVCVADCYSGGKISELPFEIPCFVDECVLNRCKKIQMANVSPSPSRIEYNAQSLTRIIYWPEPYQCTGKEKRLAHCPLRMNGQIYGHKYGCNWKGKDFVFIHCGETNLDPDYEYWGGIRFSVKEFEQELFHARIHDAVTHSAVHRHESILEYVQVIILLYTSFLF